MNPRGSASPQEPWSPNVVRDADANELTRLPPRIPGWDLSASIAVATFGLKADL